MLRRFQKAFDTVCISALLYKLVQLQIRGPFFEVLENMYNSSHAKIKINNKLSDAFDILSGTEQGHPMSPELFKIFVRDLSDELDEFTTCPQLYDMLISHLLWADDLVLLSLDAATLQKLMNALFRYCNEWGLSVNHTKTKIVIFSNENKYPNNLYSFNLGPDKIDIVESYTYLGITFNRKGKFDTAINELRKKSLKALYGMLRSISIHALSPKAVFMLFDALIKPVLLYGCQVWGPHEKWIKYILFDKEPLTCLSHIAKSSTEKFHIKFLKWYLGTHSKTCNIVAWGDTGRTPLLLEIIKLATDYFSRISAMNDDIIVKKAFREQQSMQLPWFVALQTLIAKYGAGKSSRLSVNVYSGARKLFVEQWHIDKQSYTKLDFYNLIKVVFEREKYLEINKTKHKKHLTKLRASSHKLSIETGRYADDPKTKKPPLPRSDRICKHCQDCLKLRIVEDENHVINSCPFYSEGREEFSKQLYLFQNEGALSNFSGVDHAKYFASSTDIRVCRAQAKFSDCILEKHKIFEEKRITKTKTGAPLSFAFTIS